MGESTQKIMILGAGPNQVRLIQRARELGLYVITVDYLPDNVGHKLSHRYVNCSTMDKEGILCAAEAMGIDGVVTCASDAAVPAVGYVSEKLGLPGPTYRAALTMARKDEFRAFQHAKSLAAPRFTVLTGPSELEGAIRGWTPPVMVKPADTSGSR
jgi:biotin carboxylase